MKSRWNEKQLLIKLVQFNKWGTVLLGLLLTFMLVETGREVLLDVGDFNVLMLSLAIPSVILVLFLLIFPPFKIFSSIEQLLGKGLNRDLTSAPEVRTLRKYLLVQFAINVVSGYNPYNSKFSARAVGGPVEDISSDLLSVRLGESAAHMMTVLKWLVIPLEQSAPLIYFIVLVIVLRMHKKSRELEHELSGVV